ASIPTVEPFLPERSRSGPGRRCRHRPALSGQLLLAHDEAHVPAHPSLVPHATGPLSGTSLITLTSRVKSSISSRSKSADSGIDGPLFDLLLGLKPDVCRGVGSGRAGVACPVPTGRAAVVGGLDMLSSV